MTIPAAMLIAGLVGFLISFPVLRTRGVYMVLATFAFGEAVAGFLLRTQFFGGAIGMVVPAHVEVSILVCSALIVTLLTFYLMATRFGLAMRSTNDDEAVTILMGVNVRAVQVAAFTIGGAFAGTFGCAVCAQFQLRRGAIFQFAALDLRSPVRPYRWGADCLGTVGRHVVLHAAAGIHARRRIVAVRRVWCRHCGDDDAAPAGHRDPGHDRPDCHRAAGRYAAPRSERCMTAKPALALNGIPKASAASA